MRWGTEKTLGVQKMTENGRRSCSMHDSVKIGLDALEILENYAGVDISNILTL